MRYKSEISLLLVAVCVSLMAGCAAIQPPTAMLTYQPETTATDISSAAVLLLQQYGFTVTVVQPEIGLVVSDWGAATTPGEETFSAVMSVLAYGPLHPSYGDRRQERIKLTVSTNQVSNQVFIRPTKQKYARISQWSDINLDEGDKKMVRMFAQALAAKLGLSPERVIWRDPLHKPTPPPRPPVSTDTKIATGLLFAGFVLLGLVGFLIYD